MTHLKYKNKYGDMCDVHADKYFEDDHYFIRAFGMKKFIKIHKDDVEILETIT